MKPTVKANAVFIETLIALNTFIRKQERKSKSSSWGKENLYRNKELTEIKEIKAEVNETKNKCRLGKSNPVLLLSFIFFP